MKVVLRHPAWLLVLALLFAWQSWMTLSLFGPWQQLTDDGPVLCGRHPLHLYHGYLGARTLVERGGMSVYDPAFHAGYPKTPVFDGGSRPAELALALAGGEYSPAAYKIGLAVMCLLVPVLVFLAARGARLPRGVSVLAVGFALLAWWGRVGRESLEAGDGDSLLASLFALTQVGLLLHYHTRPGALALIGVAVCGLCGWFAQPLVMILLLPLLLVYYLSAAHRHRLLWHVPLLLALALGVLANLFWLDEWVSYWWIRVPPSLETQATPGLAGLWQSPLWGEGIDRGIVAALAGLGLLGVVLLYLSGRRPLARLTGLAMLGLLSLVVAGMRSHVLGRLGACQLLMPALLFASLPAAFAVAWLLAAIGRAGWTAVVVTILAVPLSVALLAPDARGWVERMTRSQPLPIGLGEQRLALIDAVRSHTTGAARILWEDQRGSRHAARWTALLPVLTERAFVGGLDDGAGIEHAASGLVGGVLAGRPLEDWSDAELAAYCKRYNVGWIVCGDSSKARFARWPVSGAPTELPSPSERRWLIRLDRPASYALAGKVNWRIADLRGILLADAEPEKVPGEAEGQVVLSLHYQAGMRVSPSRVRIEKAIDTQDNIPFVRLRMAGPVGRIFISWEGSR